MHDTILTPSSNSDIWLMYGPIWPQGGDSNQFTRGRKSWRERQRLEMERDRQAEEGKEKEKERKTKVGDGERTKDIFPLY